MVSIVRPGSLGGQDRSQISLGVAGQAGAGLASIGQSVSQVGKASQQSNQLALAKQVASSIDLNGQELFKNSIKAKNSSVVLNKQTEATEQFVRAQQERYRQVTDKDGNPTYDRLHTDIGTIGNKILEDTANTIADPKAAENFRAKFGSYVANQKISALKQGLKQEVEFGRSSLDQGLGTLIQQATRDDIDQLGSYEQQGMEALQDALIGGLISQEEFDTRSKEFSVVIREASIQNAINNDRQRAADMLSLPSEQLGLPPERKEKLERTLDAAVRSDQVQMKKAEERRQIDELTEEASLVETIESRIQADALREDELLSLEDSVEPSKFSALKKQFLKSAEKREKERREMLVISDKVAKGENLRDVRPSSVNKYFGYLVKQQADNTGQDVSLASQAQIAAIIPVPVSDFAKKLDHEAKFGSGEKADDILAAYTYIKDRNKPSLESGFDKDATLIMEHTEFLVDRGGLTAPEALQRARDTIADKSDPLVKARSSAFKGIPEYKDDEIEETAAETFDVDPFFGDNRISQDAVHTFKQLTREGFISTGNKESAQAYAKQLMTKTHGISNVSGREEFMFAPPEKFFPEHTPDELRTILVTEAAPLLPEGVDPETVSISSDDTTVGQIQVTGTINGEQVTRNIPSWTITYKQNIDGVDVELPLIDETTGQPKRWSPLGSTALEEQRAAGLEEAREAARAFRESGPLSREEEEARQLRPSGFGDVEDITKEVFAGPEVEQDAAKPAEQTIPVKQEEVQSRDINSEKVSKAINIVSPRANPQIAQALSSNANVLAEHGINNDARLKAFMAQMSHESAGFKALVEKRSDASAERKYGVGTRVGRILGNTQRGDGAKYKGRGIIQLTGRDNYRRLGEIIGEDLINNPDRAADPDVAVEIAAVFWREKGLNELADQGKFREITRRINGGFNGLSDRQARLRKLARVDL